MTDAEIADFIRANLPIAPVPGIPEIRLHSAVPSSRIGRLTQDDEAPDAPYWAHRWAGGLALARHILDRPDSVRGRRVLDRGAGSGQVGIAAAKAGARSIAAVEASRHAVAALRLNAELNGVNIAVQRADAAGLPLPDVDTVLVGDLFYTDELARRVTAFLDRCLGAGIDVLVGDPWRRPLPLGRLEEIARYDVFESGLRSVASGVFRFRAQQTSIR